eukprot:TRINITY_DN842_c0_g1_i1.p1 TRINITY_DN842_c0_g1~~TRINITY_DN842_c0_g1_i1.p1  ORF type:complete len:539 (-),score=120.47 TRINITY_DN842_c0_g1_i1:112-1728(-)
MSAPLYLGLDSSTQTLKLIVIDSTLKEIFSSNVNFDNELPHYKTKGGVLHGEDNLTVTTPTILWVEALDLGLEKLKKSGLNLGDIAAISGSGQQHGSVYWGLGSEEKLKKLDPSLSLAEQLKDAFYLQQSPVWMDSSTTPQCKKLENAVGGPKVLAEITGSPAFERFTGAQIAKYIEKDHNLLEKTERISLVSSFVASLFLGSYAKIDHSDGSGMNLMNIQKNDWEDILLETISGGIKGGVEKLRKLLGEITLSQVPLGKISPYFVHRYGFSADCTIVPFSGDNPCSFAGLKLGDGEVAISLGTSDTVFGLISSASAIGAKEPIGCIFGNPVDANTLMRLICFKNGSLTRDHIKEKFAKGSWDTFNSYLSATPVGNNGQIGVYFLEPEIAPFFPRRQLYRFDKSDNLVQQFDDASEARAVIEGHFLSVYHQVVISGIHPVSLFATGGASQNNSITQIIADIFGVDVFLTSQPNSAAIGAALRAVHGVKGGKYNDVVGHPEFTSRVNPNLENHKVYNSILARYVELENKVLAGTLPSQA